MTGDPTFQKEHILKVKKNVVTKERLHVLCISTSCVGDRPTLLCKTFYFSCEVHCICFLLNEMHLIWQNKISSYVKKDIINKHEKRNESAGDNTPNFL